jgi:RNA polymerase primary sigma factor
MRDLLRRSEDARSLGTDEQKRLLQRAALGDAASQERLVEAYLPTVVRLAAASSAHRLPVPDLVQEGSIGLIEAIQTFSESGETDFAKFAEVHITAQLANALDAESAAVREEKAMITAAEDYDRTEVVLRRELRRVPTEQELAEKLEWTVERTRYVALVVNEARRRHDEELLAYMDPADIDFDADGDSESDSASE